MLGTLRHTTDFRLSLRALIREANVVGFMPSNSAAPPGPKILPPVSFQCGGDAVTFLAL